jgi:hypothetical protein
MGIGAPDWEAITAEAEGLAILPPPKPGDDVDGFHLERLVADGRYTTAVPGAVRDDGPATVVV